MRSELTISSREEVSPLTLILKSQTVCINEVNSLSEIINQNDSNDEKIKAIQRVITLINGGALNFKYFTKNLTNMITGITNAIQSKYIDLVKYSNALIVLISQNLGKKSEKVLGNKLIQPLVQLTLNKSKEISDCCKFSILNIARYWQTKNVLLILCDLSTSELIHHRQLCSECLCVVVECWSRPILEKTLKLITSTLKILLRESNKEIKKYSKNATTTIFAMYPNYKSIFIEDLNPEIIEEVEKETNESRIRQSDVLFEMYSECFESLKCNSNCQSISQLTNENADSNASNLIRKTIVIGSQSNKSNSEVSKPKKVELRTPENKYVKLSRMGKLKTPEMEDFSPQILSIATTPRQRNQSETPTTPTNGILRRVSLIPRSRSKSPSNQQTPTKKISFEMNNDDTEVIQRSQSPILKEKPKSIYQKRNSNSPFLSKKISQEFNEPILEKKSSSGRHVSLNAMKLFDEFRLESGHEIQFLHKIREFSNTGRNFALRDSIKTIIPGLIVCSVSNTKKISSLAIRLMFDLIKTFPDDFQEHLPSIFEMLFADLPHSDEEESKTQNFVNLLLKEIQKLYSPTLLLNYVSRQFPSNKQVQFISQICCQPECDLSDDIICCSLINLSLRFKTNESRKMMISIAKQNPDMLIKAQTDFPEEENYFESILSDVDNYSNEKVPQFSPRNIESWISQVKEIVKKYAVQPQSPRKSNSSIQSELQNDILEYVNGKNWAETRCLLYHEINSAFDQTNEIDSLFQLISFILETVGICDYHIFLDNLLIHSNNRKSSESINRIFDFIIQKEEIESILEHFIDCAYRHLHIEDIDIIRGSLNMISKVLNGSQANMIHTSMISRVFILLNDIIAKSKKAELRRFSVFCYSSLSKNPLFSKLAEKSMNELSQTQKRLVSLYSHRIK